MKKLLKLASFITIVLILLGTTAGCTGSPDSANTTLDKIVNVLFVICIALIVLGAIFDKSGGAIVVGVLVGLVAVAIRAISWALH